MELNYKEFGQGPPVIILHGLLGMLDNWQSIAKQLAESYTVFIIDQRNHGKSPHDDALNYDLMAEDLRVFMESHWIHRAHVIGHSMGGKTAMYFAVTYPDMVEKLIVVDIGVDEGKPGHDNIFKALFAVDPAKTESRKDAEKVMKPMIPESGIRQFLLKNLGRNADGRLTWKMNLKGIYDNYTNILAGVPENEPFDGPTMFIRGGKSGYLNSEDLGNIRRIFPQAEMRTIENAGHWVHAEAPEAFLEVTLQFLQL